ncbi:MAG: hypothetical protein Q4F00_05745 [bacterium]|nr:hypothetical protein [bacterium]
MAGLAVRLAAAWLQPAYPDEAFNYYISQRSCDYIIQILIGDNHTPLLHFMLLPLMRTTRCFFLLRLPMVLAGTFGILISYRLFRLGFTERESLLLTAVAACGYRLFINDSMVRPYGLLTVSFLAFWLGLSDIRRDGRPFSFLNCSGRILWGLYLSVCLMMASIHVLGIVIVFLSCFFVFQIPRGTRWATVTIYVLSVIPGVGWYVWRMLSRTSGNSVGVFSWESLANLPLLPLCVLNLKLGDHNLTNCGRLTNYLDNSDSGLLSYFYNLQFDSSYRFFLYLLGIVLWGIAVWGVFRLSKRCAWTAAFCAVMVFIPMSVLTAGVFWGYVNFYSERYFVPFTVPFLMLLSAGWQDRALLLQRSLLVLSLLICLAFPFCRFMWIDNWQSTVDFIDANKRDEDVVALYMAYPVYSFALAYDADNVQYNFIPEQEKYNPDKIPWYIFEPAMANDYLIEVMRRRRIFLIVTTLDSPDFDPSVLTWFDNHCRCVGKCRAPGVYSWSEHTTFLYELKNQSSAD